MAVNYVDAGLTAIRRIADLWRSAKPESLIDYTRQLRVEPICLIDQDCLLHDSVMEVQQSLLSIFAGYYLQAVSVSTQVGDVHVGRYLDRLNPNRDALGHAIDQAHTATGDVLRLENYQDRLPTVADFADEPALEGMALEKAKTVLDKAHAHYSVARRRLQQRRRGERRDEVGAPGSSRTMQMGEDSIKELKEMSNLSVGKIFNVQIIGSQPGAQGGRAQTQSVTVPIAIRLMANAIASASLIHILSHGTQDTSVKERYHAWRAGRLEFIKDLILCNDLIDAKRKSLMKDKDGLYSAITAQQRNGFWSGILTGDPSIGMASNLVVMSQGTAEQLEMQTNYQLRNFDQRQKIFEHSGLMIMAVMDKEWDRVTFYHRGIPLPTTLGIRELKASNKGNGPDVSDILRAYQLGNAPSL